MLGGQVHLGWNMTILPALGGAATFNLLGHSVHANAVMKASAQCMGQGGNEVDAIVNALDDDLTLPNSLF